MLSLLAKHDPDAFVPGINDLIEGREITPDGQVVKTISYAEKIEAGKRAQEALMLYGIASEIGDSTGMAEAQKALKADFQYFGYGYLDSPEQAVPDVPLVFYSFRVMVASGGYLLLFFIVMLFLCHKKPEVLENRWLIFFGLLTIPVVWLASEAGWVTAEMGRQPWTIESILPTHAAVSAIPTSSVIVTFVMFVVVFTGLLAAEISIMCREIGKATRRDLLAPAEATTANN